MIEHIRLSQEAKDQLSWLKRKTGIQNWNVLCRWAFALSMRESTRPPQINIPSDSNVEMTWKVFGGEYQDIYYALLKQRCHKEKYELTNEVLAEQFRLHLHRGIGYLFANKTINNITGLVKGVVSH